jgi:hypothetical protein
MIVYFHRNPITYEIFYVGIGKRRRAFESGGRNKVWHNYVRKYGKRIVEIVHENISLKEAYEFEKKYIAQYGLKKEGGQLVNITKGGEDNAMHHSDIVEKVRLANIRKKASPETRLKQSLLRKGKPSSQPKGYKHSPEVMERIRIINKEIANRPEVRKKNSLSKKGNRVIKKLKPVLMIDPNTNQAIIRFDCAVDAGKYFGKQNTGNIASVCNGRRNFAFGYKWKYAP